MVGHGWWRGSGARLGMRALWYVCAHGWQPGRVVMVGVGGRRLAYESGKAGRSGVVALAGIFAAGARKYEFGQNDGIRPGRCQYDASGKGERGAELGCCGAESIWLMLLSGGALWTGKTRIRLVHLHALTNWSARLHVPALTPTPTQHSHTSRDEVEPVFLAQLCRPVGCAVLPRVEARVPHTRRPPAQLLQRRQLRIRRGGDRVVGCPGWREYWMPAGGSTALPG